MKLNLKEGKGRAIQCGRGVMGGRTDVKLSFYNGEKRWGGMESKTKMIRIETHLTLVKGKMDETKDVIIFE